MALSEREQQMLDEMEQALYAEDPRFASQMQGQGSSPEQRRRRIIGAAGTLAGLGLVILGTRTSIWVGVAGFVLIVAALAYALAPPRERGGLGVVLEDGRVVPVVPPRGRARPRIGGSSRAQAARAHPSRTRPRRTGSFMERLEQRWDERRQQRY